jgi:hypothetical protein
VRTVTIANHAATRLESPHPDKRPLGAYMYRRLLVPLLICCVGAGCARTQSTASPVAGSTAATPAFTEQTGSIPPSADHPSADQKGTDQKGLRAYIDPDTGQLRAPTEAELAAEATKGGTTAAAKDRADVQEIKLPNGMTEVRVGKDSEVAEITCIQADGSFGPCSPEKAAELRARGGKKVP